MFASKGERFSDLYITVKKRLLPVLHRQKKKYYEITFSRVFIYLGFPSKNGSGFSLIPWRPLPSPLPLHIVSETLHSGELPALWEERLLPTSITCCSFVIKPSSYFLTSFKDSIIFKKPILMIKNPQQHWGVQSKK